MKKVVNVGIGGSSFVVDEDAYQRLDLYLERFRNGMDAREASEVMEDVEQRIAELFMEYTNGRSEVVSLAIVERVITQLGYPEDGGETSTSNSRENKEAYHYTGVGEKPRKRYYRDPDDKMIGGVCSGLAAYFDVDVVLFRIVAIVALICGSVGFWVYLILWIAVPLARTATEKLEMRGLPVTADNLRRFSGRR